MTALDDLTRDYRVAFLQYLPRHDGDDDEMVW